MEPPPGTYTLNDFPAELRQRILRSSAPSDARSLARTSRLYAGDLKPVSLSPSDLPALSSLMGETYLSLFTEHHVSNLLEYLHLAAVVPVIVHDLLTQYTTISYSTPYATLDASGYLSDTFRQRGVWRVLLSVGERLGIMVQHTGDETEARCRAVIDGRAVRIGRYTGWKRTGSWEYHALSTPYLRGETDLEGEYVRGYPSGVWRSTLKTYNARDSRDFQKIERLIRQMDGGEVMIIFTAAEQIWQHYRLVPGVVEARYEYRHRYEYE